MKNHFPVLVAFVVTLSIVTGCTVFNAEVAPRAAKVVKDYCAEPLATRQALRAQVAALTAPNTITVHCEGDPTP